MDVIICGPSPSSTSHWMLVLMCLCAGAACHGLKDGFHYSVVNPQTLFNQVYLVHHCDIKSASNSVPVRFNGNLEEFQPNIP